MQTQTFILDAINRCNAQPLKYTRSKSLKQAI